MELIAELLLEEVAETENWEPVDVMVEVWGEMEKDSTDSGWTFLSPKVYDIKIIDTTIAGESANFEIDKKVIAKRVDNAMEDYVEDIGYDPAWAVDAGVQRI